jgi:parallel beta-helix repeat protein
MKHIVLSLLLFLTMAGSAWAANCGDTNSDGITDTNCACGDTIVGASGYTYTLPENMSCSDQGLIVGSHSITIDGNGKTITGPGIAGGTTTRGIYNNGYDHVTITHLHIAQFAIGVFLKGGSNNGTITNSTISYCRFGDESANLGGIVLEASESNTLTDNLLDDNGIAIKLYSSSTSNVISGNTLLHNLDAIRIVSSNSNTVSGNTLDSNMEYGVFIDGTSNAVTGNYIYGSMAAVGSISSSTTVSSNTLDGNATSSMLTYTDVTRAATVGSAVSVVFSMFDMLGTACPSCTYTAVTSPVENVTKTKDGNKVTVSFTPSRSGTYSLILTVTDSHGNTAKRRLIFLVGSASSKETTYYFRGGSGVDAQDGPPFDHGQAYGNGHDSHPLLLSIPEGDEYGMCGNWTQSSIDVQPDYPLAYLSSISINVWYAGWSTQLGVREYASYVVDMSNSTAIPGESEDEYDFIYSQITRSFTDLNWGMDYPNLWYGTTVVLTGDVVAWKSTHDNPSTVTVSRRYTTTPIVKSISNDKMNVLSATTPVSDTSGARIVVENPRASADSTDVVLDSYHRPFQHGTTTISSDGTATLASGSIAAGSVQSFESVPLDITPDAGSVAVSITTWNSRRKTWAENGSGASSAGHTVGNLSPGKTYTVSIDGTKLGTYTADQSGKITFNYAGGYSSHTFDVSGKAGAAVLLMAQ